MRHVLPAACLLLAACAHKPAEAPKASLYDRLGQKPAIVAVVDEFLKRVAKDDRINARFSNTDLKHLENMLVDQICQAAGGPCMYTGKDMKAAHAGMNITDQEFVALVEDLKGALEKLQVPGAEQNDLLGALGPMKPDIVGR